MSEVKYGSFRHTEPKLTEDNQAVTSEFIVYREEGDKKTTSVVKLKLNITDMVAGLLKIQAYRLTDNEEGHFLAADGWMIMKNWLDAVIADNLDGLKELEKVLDKKDGEIILDEEMVGLALGRIMTKIQARQAQQAQQAGAQGGAGESKKEGK